MPGYMTATQARALYDRAQRPRKSHVTPRLNAALAAMLTGEIRVARESGAVMADVKAWAITSAPHVLQVHAPTLRKQILAGGVPETLAVIKEEPRGALAKDLSSWLTEEAETDD